MMSVSGDRRQRGQRERKRGGDDDDERVSSRKKHWIHWNDNEGKKETKSEMKTRLVIAAKLVSTLEAVNNPFLSSCQKLPSKGPPSV
jgi:hypothetical protein